MWKTTLWLIALLGILSSPVDAKHTLLRIHTESLPMTLDPAQATGSREFLILQAIFEGLTRYHPKTLEPLPGVAESWKISSNGLVYTFLLRKEAKWSDGKPVTAQDFWNAWETVLNPKTKSPYAANFYYIVGAEDYAAGLLKDPKKIGMKVIDPHTFEITLTGPVSYFLNLTSFMVAYPRRLDATPVERIGNGPFILKEQTPTTGVELEKNPNYWGKDEVRMETILVQPFSDFETALKFYDRTAIDITADLPPEKIPLLKFRSDYHNASMLRIDYLIVNCRKEPFNNREFRRALGYAIDRKKITDEILKRGDIPYGFFVPPGLPVYQNPKNPQTFDPWKAQASLRLAGFEQEKKPPPIIIQFSEGTDRKMVAEAIKAMWEKYLGLKVILREEKWSDYLKHRIAGDYDVSWGGWYGDYLDPNTFLDMFMTTNRQNYTGWGSPAYDKLVESGQTALDPKERMKLFQKAEGIMLWESPAIPVFVKAKNYLIQPYVKGYYSNLQDIHPLRDVYSLRP